MTKSERSRTIPSMQAICQTLEFLIFFLFRSGNSDNHKAAIQAAFTVHTYQSTKFWSATAANCEAQNTTLLKPS